MSKVIRIDDEVYKLLEEISNGTNTSISEVASIIILNADKKITFHEEIKRVKTMNFED